MHTLADAFAWADEPIDWVVPEFLAAGEKAVIAGPPKALKTWLELHIARVVTTGGHVLGENPWHVTKPQTTMIVQEESQRQRWGRRLKSVFEDIPHAPMIFAHRANFSLLSRKHVDWLIRTMKEQKVRLLFIDPLQRVTPGINENDSGAMEVPWSAVHRIATETNAAVVVIHHSRKDSGRPSMHDIRGSSRSAGEVDMMLVVQKDDEYGKLECYLEGRELIRSETDNLLIQFNPTAPWEMAFAGVKLNVKKNTNKTLRAVEKVLREADDPLKVAEIRSRVIDFLGENRTTESIRKALHTLEENGEAESMPVANSQAHEWLAVNSAE